MCLGALAHVPGNVRFGGLWHLLDGMGAGAGPARRFPSTTGSHVDGAPVSVGTGLLLNMELDQVQCSKDSIFFAAGKMN